jgi:hypothetical protein
MMMDLLIPLKELCELLESVAESEGWEDTDTRTGTLKRAQELVNYYERHRRYYELRQTR